MCRNKSSLTPMYCKPILCYTQMAAMAEQKGVKCSNFQNVLLLGLSFILHLQTSKLEIVWHIATKAHSRLNPAKTTFSGKVKTSKNGFRYLKNIMYMVAVYK